MYIIISLILSLHSCPPDISENIVNQLETALLSSEGVYLKEPSFFTRNLRTHTDNMGPTFKLALKKASHFMNIGSGSAVADVELASSSRTRVTSISLHDFVFNIPLNRMTSPSYIGRIRKSRDFISRNPDKIRYLKGRKFSAIPLAELLKFGPVDVACDYLGGVYDAHPEIEIRNTMQVLSENGIFAILLKEAGRNSKGLYFLNSHVYTRNGKWIPFIEWLRSRKGLRVNVEKVYIPDYNAGRFGRVLFLRKTEDFSPENITDLELTQAPDELLSTVPSHNQSPLIVERFYKERTAH